MSDLDPRICVVVSDRASATTSLGRALAAHLPQVFLSKVADPSADLNYFLDPLIHAGAVATAQMGWFAQLPEDSGAPAYARARLLDHVVTPTGSLGDRLRAEGVASVDVIAPGYGRPAGTLRVGVLTTAATPHPDTVALVAALADMDQIALEFLSPEAVLPGRPPDVFLIPEDGPGADSALAAASAAAQAEVPVIAPHGMEQVAGRSCLTFEDGAVRSLQKRLEELRAHLDTEMAGWAPCAQAHAALFAAVVKRARAPARTGDAATFDGRVRLLLHGDEQKTLGGPTIRVPQTAQALRAAGLQAEATSAASLEPIPEDVVHLFNVWPPHSALHRLRHLKAARKTVVFSPIYLDLSERRFWQSVPQLLTEGPADTLAEHFDAFRAYNAARGRLDEILPGYHAMLREMVTLADHVIFLSDMERAALAGIGAEVDDACASLIPNPVDVDAWSGGDPDLFRRTYLENTPGPQDYIICVGRIEDRKNQALLARAVRDLPVRLVLAGHAGNAHYADLVRKIAGPDTLFLGRLDGGSDMLRSALAGARAFALPSWAEGASLAVLEAAACGVPLVLSETCSERELFGDLAYYCNPADHGSIRTALQQALDAPPDSAALSALVRDHNSWDAHVHATTQAYAAAAAQGRDGAHKRQDKPQDKSQDGAAEHCQPQQIVVDITAVNDRTQVGRAVAHLCQDLQTAPDVLKLIFWDPSRAAFRAVPSHFRTIDQALRYCRGHGEALPHTPAALPADCVVLTPAGQSLGHLNALEDLKARFGCMLVALVQDTRALQRPFHAAAEDVAQAGAAVRRLAGLVDSFVTFSQDMADTLARTVSEACLPAVDIAVLQPAVPVREDMPETPSIAPCAPGAFVLAAGDLDAASNHDMLCQIWAQATWDLHLVLLVPSGGAATQLSDRIAQDAQMRARVHVLTDVSEADRTWFYRSCLVSLYPAYGAHIGWPVYESLAHGVPCIASCDAALPGVPAGAAQRIAPGDGPAWETAIATLASGALARHVRAAVIAAQYDPPRLRDTALALCDILRQPRAVRRFRAVYPGDVQSAAATAAPLSICFRSGWHPADTDGRWAALPKACLSLNAPVGWHADAGAFQVLLRLKAQMPPASTEILDIACGGTSVFRSDVRQAHFPLDVVISVPVGAVGHDGVFELHFSFPTSVVQPVAGHAGRAVGIGLEAAICLDPQRSNPLYYLSAPQNWSGGAFALTADMSIPAHRAVIAPGLDFSSAWGVGAPCGQLVLHVPVLPDTPPGDLTVTVRPIATQDAPVTARLFWNGHFLAERVWHCDVPDRFTLPVAQAAGHPSAPAVLSIYSASVLTPADLGLGETTSHAGLGLTDLVFTPQVDTP